VVHSQTPLLIPATHAARVLTIHDLHFLTHPDQGEREIQRDFPALVHAHARRADHVVVSSKYAANEVRQRLGIEAGRVTVCAAGAPAWAAEIARARLNGGPGRAIAFLGTVEPRKNVRGLLEAYARLRQRQADALPLVIAGGIRDAARPDLERAATPPLAGHVEIRGYVSDTERRALYRDAAMLVLPSFDEGFGLPVLEAMACGVPVVISNRGSLPEVAGDAARPIDPDDVNALASEMARLLDPAAAAGASDRGLRRASQFTWQACAESAMRAYESAIARRRERGA